MKNSVFKSLHEKKHSLNQIVPIAYALEKTFFAASTFEGLSVLSFQIE